MKYTIVALKNKVQEMYPEIDRLKVSVGIQFVEDKDAYRISFSRGKDVLITHLGRQDADDCMNNIRCIHLGVQVAQFIRNFEDRIEFGRNAAA